MSRTRLISALFAKLSKDSIHFSTDIFSLKRPMHSSYDTFSLLIHTDLLCSISF